MLKPILSKLRRFVCLIPYIIQGWGNWFLDIVSDIRYADVFEERMRICKSCGKYLHGICSECGCVLAAKTKSEDSACPDGKWSAVRDIPSEKDMFR